MIGGIGGNFVGTMGGGAPPTTNEPGAHHGLIGGASGTPGNGAP